MLSIDHSTRTRVQAPLPRCLDVLGDVERYPDWASLIKSAGPAGGVPGRLDLRAELMGIGFEMTCELEVGETSAALRRVPYGDDDAERYEATWRLAPAGGATDVELRVVAELDAPGPAALIRGRVERKLVEELLADFRRRLEAA